MRVLCISSHTDTLNSVRPEAESFIGMARAGVHMVVMTQLDSPYGERMRDAGITIIDYHPRKKLSRDSIRRIRAAIAEHDIDIVYAFNNRAICNAAFACIGRDVRLITYRGQTGNLSRFDPASYLTHLHPRVNGIIGVADAVSDFVRPLVRRSVSVDTVYKGHDLGWYSEPAADRATLGLAHGDFVVGCIANNRPRKGVPYLIDACARLRDISALKLMLIGHGMDEQTLGDELRRHSLVDRVVLLGPRSDATAVIQAADVSVLPSTRREGLPKTVIESMAYGIPTVVTDTGGNAELVADEQSGLVVPVEDAQALADAILRLHDDRALAARFGNAGRERIDQAFNVSSTVAQTIAVFEKQLARG